MAEEEYKGPGCLSAYIMCVFIYFVYLVLCFMTLRVIAPELESESALETILAGCAIASILTVILIRFRERIVRYFRR